MLGQQQQRRDNKKIRDNQKRTHAALNLEPTLSPISPEPVEPEIPSVEEMAMDFQGPASFDQLAEQYFGGSYSHAPPSPPPDFGPISGHTYAAAGSAAATSSYPFFGSESFGTGGSSMVGSLFASQSEPSRPSAADVLAHSAAASIFGTHLGTHWGDQSPLARNGDGNGDGQ